MIVRAASGMGKSTLVQRFLERARSRQEKAVILDGRCYEREAVPYKAMDSLIDDLSDVYRLIAVWHARLGAGEREQSLDDRRHAAHGAEARFE